ncbi:MAG: serine protease [Legionellaceae bacterium]|nr:serine protease [Legionellaceae bacterium]
MQLFKKVALMFISLITSNVVYSQNLGQDRIDRLKTSVVQILINDQPAGTGFLTHGDLVLTNFHVIQPSIVIERDRLEFKNVTVRLHSGELRKMKGFHNGFRSESGRDSMVKYDYFFIALDSIVKHKIAPFKLGTLANIDEGDMVLTAGYPLFLSQQFVSTGWLSTKYEETLPDPSDSSKSYSRSVAWADLTMSKGNSGGLLIKLGSRPEDDLVIGMTTFIQAPFAKSASELLVKSAGPGWDVKMGNVSQRDANDLFAKSALYATYGISGCVDFKYVLPLIIEINKQVQ